jgi:hypothetical protein
MRDGLSVARGGRRNAGAMGHAADEPGSTGADVEPPPHTIASFARAVPFGNANLR